MTATIHRAGQPQLGGLYQQCARCGYVLQDLTGGQPMVLEEDAPLGIPYWTPGNSVAVDGNSAWFVAPGTPLDPRRDRMQTHIVTRTHHPQSPACGPQRPTRHARSPPAYPGHPRSAETITAPRSPTEGTPNGTGHTTRRDTTQRARNPPPPARTS